MLTIFFLSWAFIQVAWNSRRQDEQIIMVRRTSPQQNSIQQQNMKLEFHSCISVNDYLSADESLIFENRIG